MIFINNTESTLSVRHNRLVLARRNNLVEQADLRGLERLGMHSFLSLSNPRIATISETARCPLVLPMRTKKSTALPMFAIIARCGSSIPLCKTQSAKRVTAWRAELAWRVQRLPACPVFNAWSKSKASPPRTSPTIIVSGQ